MLSVGKFFEDQPLFWLSVMSPVCKQRAVFTVYFTVYLQFAYASEQAKQWKVRKSSASRYRQVARPAPTILLMT